MSAVIDEVIRYKLGTVFSEPQLQAIINAQIAGLEFKFRTAINEWNPAVDAFAAHRAKMTSLGYITQQNQLNVEKLWEAISFDNNEVHRRERIITCQVYKGSVI